MRSLPAQARATCLRTVTSCVMRHPPIFIPRAFLPLDLNDIDNYSQVTLSRFVRISA
jgi:hypothetical protein